MRLLSLISLGLALPLPSFLAAQEPRLPPAPVPAVNPLVSRIAFGSCSNPDDPLPILRTVLEWEPDLFVYLPDTNPNKTVLGDAQWEWLRDRLEEPADLRVIGSSIQFGHQHNGWESWTNFPLELIKFVDLINETKANGVVFISGDVHGGELSVLKTPDCYPLHDLTASGLNRDWNNLEPNQNRHGEACMDFHFGMLDIDWSGDPSVQLRIHEMTGRARVRKTVRLSGLRF